MKVRTVLPYCSNDFILIFLNIIFVLTFSLWQLITKRPLFRLLPNPPGAGQMGGGGSGGGGGGYHAHSPYMYSSGTGVSSIYPYSYKTQVRIKVHKSKTDKDILVDFLVDQIWINHPDV